MHLNTKEVSLTLELKLLASVAIHCDKYCCIQPMKPWIVHWFNFKNKNTDTSNGRQRLVAAYMFEDAEAFASISKSFIERGDPTFNDWPVDEEHYLPNFITGECFRYPMHSVPFYTISTLFRSFSQSNEAPSPAFSENCRSCRN